jgi:hypothetical protein
MRNIDVVERRINFRRDTKWESAPPMGAGTG